MKPELLIADDPVFTVGSLHIAAVTISILPAGVNCSARLFIGPDHNTIIASSGLVDFVSGEQATVFLGIEMPGAPGVYKAFLDVFSGAELIKAYQATEDVVIEAGTGYISGNVTDNNNHYLPGVTISAGGRSTVTSASGTFELSLPAGTYDVTASHPDYESQVGSVSVIPGAYVNAFFKLTPAMTGYSVIARVLAYVGTTYNWVGGYVYPSWYDIRGSAGCQAYLELYVTKKSNYWRWGNTVLKYPNGSTRSVGLYNGVLWDYAMWTPIILNQAGQYYMTLNLESSMDNSNWYVSDAKTIKLCYMT